MNKVHLKFFCRLGATIQKPLNLLTIVVPQEFKRRGSFNTFSNDTQFEAFSERNYCFNDSSICMISVYFLRACLETQG